MNDLDKYYPIVETDSKPSSKYSLHEYVEKMFAEESPEYKPQVIDPVVINLDDEESNSETEEVAEKKEPETTDEAPENA